ncbi:sulfatase [Sphingobium chlorophenolicum L-1]|uniref:Sulfatase n=1 Tax=Sphingobium chlorophenolicum L-1 TaxID=690566 RepID=F6F3B5_SPHCR|nr:sulfatase-like hydrolase/transferase [Sphingobium chlorophenolicum]AEG50927.1 sulfatase [Sphingobium chlorophenolicum L-1]
MRQTQWNRRQALFAVGTSLACFSTTASARVASAGVANRGPRPNILWFVSEDNNPLMGCYGDPLARTPNLDAFAKRSVLYENAFSTSPVCSTSRFTILTGLYPESCSPAQHMRSTVAQLPKEIIPYPTLMREAGYYCTNNFKTDYNCSVDPQEIWDESSAKAHWRNRPQGAPFMAVFNYFTTHESQIFFETKGSITPSDVRVPGYLPDTPEVRGDIASYYNRMEILDRQFGERLAQLEADGLAEDTIIFYYSDNGGVFPRSKRYAYDEGLRTALMIHVPPKWQHLVDAPPGSRVKAPVTYADLAPTLLSIVGRPALPYMQGRALLGPYARPPLEFAFGGRNRMDENYDFVRSVTDGRWRYIRNYTPERPWGMHGSFEWLAKGYQSWEREKIAGRLDSDRLRFFQSKPYEELYDLSTDRDQLKDLSKDPAAQGQLIRFRAALDRHMLAICDNGFIPEGAPEEGYWNSRDRTRYPLERLMTIGAAAAQRDRKNLGLFERSLTDANPIVRYWAVMGLLMLGEAAGAQKPQLLALLRNDPSVQVRIVAAQAVAPFAAKEAVAFLGGVATSEQSFEIPLQAVAALTALGGLARPALPALKLTAKSSNEYVGEASRYAVARLEGTYTPATVTFDLDAISKPFRGEIPPPTP